MLKNSLLIAFGLLLLTSPLSAADRVGKALIIGVERYEKANLLRFVGNDVRRLSEVLSDRCGYDVTMVLDTALGDQLESIDPITHRDAMMRRIEQWIENIAPTENAIVYFSGHGYLDADNKLYLAVINCDPSDPSPGGIPVAWLKQQLEQCRSQRKVLILDACHSGSSKGNSLRGIPAKSIAVELVDARGVTTLASCEGDEESYLWDAKQQSLFSYWLTEGMKGHADIDSSGETTFDELSDYVVKNVSTVADIVLKKRQTPIVVGQRESVVSLPMKPLPLSKLISEMADQIDTQLRCEGFNAVGVVPSFTSGQRGNELNLDFGTLPSFIAAQLRRDLANKGRRDYRIVSENAMREAMDEKNAGSGDVGASKTTSLVAKNSSDSVSIPAIVSGRVCTRQGAIIRLSCLLTDAANMVDIATAGGVAYLNESERAMIPDSIAQLVSQASANARHQTDSNASPSDQSEHARVDAQIIESVNQFDTLSDQPHPLARSNYPFRVKIAVKNSDGQYVKVPFIFRGNKCNVHLKHGDIYGILIKNQSGSGVWARVLVDGLGTLAQSTGYIEKGLIVEETQEKEAVIAPRVSLDRARAWHLKNEGLYQISGFYENGDNACQEFKVVDASDSIAAKQNYLENVGLITVAFYSEEHDAPESPTELLALNDERGPQFKPKGSQTRGLGTGGGEVVHQVVTPYDGPTHAGQLLAVLHIHYIE